MLRRGSRLISPEDRQVIGKAQTERRREWSEQQRVHAHLVKRSEVRLQQCVLLLFGKPVFDDQGFSLAEKPVEHLRLPVDVKQELLDRVKTHARFFLFSPTICAVCNSSRRFLEPLKVKHSGIAYG